MPSRRVRHIALTLMAVVAVGGCVVPGSLDRALPLPLHIKTTPTTVDVDAVGLAPTSAVYLCPTAPPYLPDDTADRIGWNPGGDCHDFGRHDTRDGLSISLPLADLTSSSEWAAFEAVPDWYLLLVELDGELATSSIRSQFHAPQEVTVSPASSGADATTSTG
jgi:hypothetical protein